MLEQQFEYHKSLKCVYGSNLFQHYTINNILGSGSSNVYLAHNPRGDVFAIKELTSHESDIHKEILRLKMLNHNHITKYIDACILVQHFNEYSSQTIGYICMELAQCNLEQYKQRYTTVPIELIAQTLDAFSYLQSLQIAHCDIKPANIVVTSLTPFVCKVCDIGSSKGQSIIVGPVGYMSPEMIHSNVHDYNASDVFSLGLVFLYVYKDIKFTVQERRTMTDYQIDHMIQSNLGNDSISRLIRKMLLIDPAKRYDFHKLILYWGYLNQNKQQTITFPNVEKHSSLEPREACKFNTPPRRQIISQYESSKTTLNTKSRASVSVGRRSPVKSAQINMIHFLDFRDRRQLQTPLKLSPLKQKRRGKPGEFQIKLLNQNI